MKNVILLRYGELHLKGKNKGYFERVLLSNIRKVIASFGAKAEKISGRYLVFDYDFMDEELLIEKYGNKLKIEHVVVNPTAGSHCGPDTVGIAFYASRKSL